MLIVGAPYALPLAVVTAILELVPLLGPTLATILLSLAALTQGLVAGIVILAFFTLYHVVEGHSLRPLVYGRKVGLSPLAVLLSILVGTELAGVLGAIAAIPVGGSIGVVLGELLPARGGRREEAAAG